jgi:hypothetical protein
VFFPSHEDIVGFSQLFIVEAVRVKRSRILVEGQKFSLQTEQAVTIRKEWILGYHKTTIRYRTSLESRESFFVDSYIFFEYGFTEISDSSIQGCGSGSGLDPDSMGCLDPDPGARKRRK